MWYQTKFSLYYFYCWNPDIIVWKVQQKQFYWVFVVMITFEIHEGVPWQWIFNFKVDDNETLLFLLTERDQWLLKRSSKQTNFRLELFSLCHVDCITPRFSPTHLSSPLNKCHPNWIIVGITFTFGRISSHIYTVLVLVSRNKYISGKMIRQLFGYGVQTYNSLKWDLFAKTRTCTHTHIQTDILRKIFNFL